MPKNNYQEYILYMSKKNFKKRYQRVKTKEDNSKINSIQTFIKELLKLKNFCNNIEEKKKTILGIYNLIVFFTH